MNAFDYIWEDYHGDYRQAALKLADVAELIETFHEQDVEDEFTGYLYENRESLLDGLASETLQILMKVDSGLSPGDMMWQAVLAGNDREELINRTPHYLALTSQCYRRPDGGLYAVNPPLKGEEDRLALWEAAMDGTLDILSTDHCPYTREQKLSETSYKRTPCGLSGIQTRIPYLFSEGMARSMSLERFVALTSENAAKFYGLYPRKGCLRPGSDADVVLINRDRRCRFGREDFAGAEDYNIFEGWEFRGAVERVFLRGREVFAEGAVRADRGSGRYIGVYRKDG